jgi:hypothetical protein
MGSGGQSRRSAGSPRGSWVLRFQRGDSGCHRGTVSLAGGLSALAGDTTESEDNDSSQDAEYNDNDEQFDQGETTLNFCVPTLSSQPVKSLNHLSSSISTCIPWPKETRPNQ